MTDQPSPITDHRSVDSIVQHIEAMPASDQLEIIRRLAPSVIAALDEDVRNVFIDQLNLAISAARRETPLRR